MKRKQILGSFFTTVEKDDAEIVKEINKRIKLEKDKINKEKEFLTQEKTLKNELQNKDSVEA